MKRADLNKPLGWHWLWFGPVCVWALFRFVVPDAVSGYSNLRLFLRHWHWGALLSPSADVFLAAVVASVTVPLYILSIIPVLAHLPRRAWVATLAAILAIPVSCVLIQLLIWGSYPFESGHLRMIPFIPWPERPLF